MLDQASREIGTSLTDAPLDRPLAPGRHARRPLRLALVRGVFPMVIEGMAVALDGANQRPLLGRGALSTTVSHDRFWCPCGRTSASPPRTWIRSLTHGSRDGTGALVERGEILHLNVQLTMTGWSCSAWGGWKRHVVTCSKSPQSETWCNETL